MANISEKRKYNTDINDINQEVPQKLKCTSQKLGDKDFDVPCEILAKFLLGKILARKVNNVTLRARIVETECYLGGEDKASHSYKGRRSVANEPMYMKPGTAYVYMTYGMYYCFNISSQEPGGAVLLRALDPIDGIEDMTRYREKSRKSESTKTFKEHQLCNGPSKLCMSFNINKEICNKLDLCDSDELWIEHNYENREIQVVTSSRIGIESAGEEWVNKPLRFYVLGNKSVSKRDKIVEKLILERSE